MRKLFDGLKAALTGFVEQRQDLILLLECDENDGLVAMKLLQQLEQDAGTDVHLLFADAFHEPASFVEATIKRLEVERDIACASLVEEGREPLPPLPAALYEPGIGSVERLIRAIGAARALVPEGGGHRLVWAMFPLEITNPRAYEQLVSALAPWHGAQPWMRGVRLIFRVPGEAGELAKAPGSRVVRADFGSDAIQSALQADAEDEACPIEERMQNVVMLAHFDYAYGRNDEALRKFQHVLGHYQQTGNLTMQAICLNGMGDVYRHRIGDLERARHWYECAVPPAMQSKVPVVMAMLTKNLGHVAFEQGRHADAEQYFDGLEKLASFMLDPQSKADALEWRGRSQEALGAEERAIESYANAARVSAATELDASLEQNLGHLDRLSASAHRREAVDRLRSELAELRNAGDAR